jgi:hypothetical protein
MGLFSDVKGMVKAFTGEAGADAAAQAGALGAEGYDKSMEALQQGYQQAGAFYDPYTQAGGQAFQDVVSQSTPEGYVQSLMSLQQSPAIQQLIGENMRVMNNQLSSAGLARSGYGMRQAADLNMNTLKGIQDMLYGRRSGVASTGLQTGMARTGMDVDKTNALTQMILGKYGVRGNALMSAAASRAQGAGNIANLLIGGTKAVTSAMTGMPMPGAGAGIPASTQGTGLGTGGQ